MKVIITAICFSTLFFFNTAQAQAYPNCINAGSDPDGDGWGWENGLSCIVGSGSASTSECIDSDGDGWGWDGESSCRIDIVDTTQPEACFDTPPYDDQWGWDGYASCLLDVYSYPDPVTPVCEDTAPVGDTWGWNGTSTCRIAPVLEPQDTSAIAGLWADPDNVPGTDGDYYTLINDDGSLVSYEAYPSQGCFFEELDNPEEYGFQFRPLGDNLYEAYSYDLYAGTLEIDITVFEMYITNANTLYVSVDDVYFDDAGVEVMERVTFELPPAAFSVEDITLCE